MISYEKQQYGLLAFIIFAVFFILASNALAATVPGAPTGLAATPGNAQVSLSWNAPASDGGSPLTNYLVDYQLTSTSTWTQFGLPVSTSTSAIITGLTNGSAYNFEVYAVNAVGASASSSNMVTATPATVPTAPTIGIATRGNAQALITFSVPSSGGSAILYYTVSDGVGQSATGTTSPIVVTGLTNGTSYTFTVTATNGVGTSAASGSSNSVTPAAATYGGGYLYYVPITVTSTTSIASGTQSNFPMLVSSTLSQWKYPGGHISNLVTAPNGGLEPADLVFATSTANCGISNLNFENESYTSSTGALVDWVNVPSLSAGSVIYACYGNSLVNTDQSNPAWAWSNGYAGVWHLDEGSGTTAYDSTVNANNGTWYGAASGTSGYYSAGNIGQWAGAFDGSSTYTGMASSTALQVPYLTFSSWINLSRNSSADSFFGGYGNTGFIGFWCQTGTGNTVGCSVGNGATSSQFTASVALTLNTWYHVALTYDGTTEKIYVNGALKTSSTKVTGQLVYAPPGAANGFDIGNITGLTAARYFPGLIGDTNVASIARSAGWISTEYYNQLSPSTFYTIGSEIGVPGAPTGLAAIPGSTQISLSWTAPSSTGGSPITNYIVDYQLSASSTWTQFGLPVSTSTSATVTGLTNGSAYNFEVYAVNAVGASASSSNMVTATPRVPATYYWTGSAAAAINSATNWTTDVNGACGDSNGGAVPATADTAIFDSVCNTSSSITTAWSVNALTLNSGYTGTLAVGTQNLSVSGTSTITSGTVSIGASSGTGWTTAGLSIASGGTVTASGNALITDSGNWSNSGTFTPGSGTVTFNGSGTQTLNSGGTTNGQFNNIIFSGAGTLQTLTNNIQINGNFTLNSGAGTFDDATNNKNITVNGNVTMSNSTTTMGTATTWTMGGSFNFSNITNALVRGTSLLVMTGTGNLQAPAVYNANRNVLYALTIASSAVITAPNTSNEIVFASGLVTVNGTATLNSGGASFYCEGGFTQGVNGVVNGTGQLRFAGGAITLANVAAITPAGIYVDTNESLPPNTYSPTATFYFGSDPTSTMTLPSGTYTFTSNVIFSGYEDTISEVNNPTLIFQGNVTIVTSTLGVETFSNNSTNANQLTGTANQTINLVGKNMGNWVVNKPTSGTVTWTSGDTITAGGAWSMKALTVPTGFTLNMGTNNIAVSGSSTITGTTTIGASSGTGWTTAGLSIASGGTVTASGNALITDSGNWSNSGTFTPGSGTVTLTGSNQSISGNTTFYNFTKSVSSADTLTFGAGTTQTFASGGTLTLQGSAGNRLSLRSSSSSIQWNINPQGTTTISYVDVKDSDNVNAAAINVSLNDSINSGDNTNWNFMTIPGAPTGLAATASSTQVSLSWNAPSNGGAPITNYIVDYQLTSTSTWTQFGLPTSTATSATVTGLTNGTSYNFEVYAVNAIGTSASSSNMVTAEPDIVPAAPTIGTATSSNAQASVAFSAPTPNGGSAILYYTVSDGVGQSATGTGSPIVVTGLTNGTAYTFTVTATNEMGAGAASGSSNSVTPATIPDAPTGLTATPGNAQVALSWMAPVNSGGSLITNYLVYDKIDASSTWIQLGLPVSTSTSSTIAGLTNGVLYDFEVYAVNTVGTSASSSNIATVTPVTVPGAPIIGIATPSSTQSTVTFTAPTSTGGSIILYYTAFANAGGFSATSTGSPITVTGLTNGTSYTFTVTATNAVGNSSSSASSNSVTPATVPDPPTAIVAVALNASVALAWSPPGFTGGAPVIDYVIEDQLVSGGTWSVFADGISTATSTTVTGLTNGTSYNFRVSAVNSAGQGSPSSVVSSTPITVPDAPIGASATLGNTQATITFTPPANDGGSPITGYTVTSNPGSFTANGTSSPITVTGLTNGTAYTFTVTAINAAGTGAASTSSSPVTPATVPNAPTAPSATSSNAEAIVTFTPPANNGGATVLYYTAISNPGNISATSTGSSITVTGLTNGTPYTFTVTATNSVGTGSASVASNSVTPMTVPDAPVIGSSTAGNAQATVSFSSPDTDGGSPITGYIVTSNPGSFTANGTSSPITVTGLTNGTSYTFTVTAINSVGTGAASAASNSATPITVPDPPTGLTPTSGNAQVSLSWTAPANDGGSAITDYVMEYELIGSGLWSVFAEGTSTATNGAITGLVNGTSYDFEVAAVNAAGQGSPSASVTAVPVTVPDAPVIGSSTAGNAQATVSFSPPDTDGGSPITGYTVTSNSGGFTGIGTSSPIVVTGLTNGTAYTFTVTATNAVGTGASSTPSNSVTPATVPGAPSSVSAVAGNTQATISFTAPSNTGGSAITGYTVTDNTDTYTATGTGSPITVTGLTNGDTYTFTVTATNAVGIGAASPPSNSVTLSTQPSAPLNLAATVEESGIGLSWSPPSSDGGTPVTNYVVEYELTSGGTWSVFANGVSTSTTAIVTGLSDRTSYNFRVSAVNAIGQSSPSAVVTASPGEPAQVLIQNFSNLTLPHIGTAVRITNEGSVAYEYQYTWCVTALPGAPCNDAADIFSSTGDKNIQPGQNFDTVLTSTVSTPGNYWFTIIASYGSTSSTATQSFTAVATYPDAPTSVSATAGNAQATVSFNIPDTDGGSSITGYKVTSNPGGIIATGTGSPIIVTGLTNGTAYTFTVTATNAVGTGAASAPSASVTPATVPGAPTAVSALAGNGEVTLSWLPPSSDGGSSIINYVVEYKLSSDSNWTVFATPVSTATTATVIGLTNNVSYDFEVSAVNAIGQSIVNSASATLPSNTPVYSSGGGGGSGGGGSSIYYYSINASVAPNGSINPSGSVVLTQGSGQTFTITPIIGYQVANVFVDNNPIGATTTYTFNGIAGNHSISAVFSPIGAPVTVTTTTSTIPPAPPTQSGKTTSTPPSTNSSGVPPIAPVAAPTSTKITGNEVSATPTTIPTPSSTPTVTVERGGVWMLWALVALFAILAFGGLFIFLVYRRREKKE